MENKFIVRTTLDAAACKALARHQTRRLKSLFLGIDILLAVCTALLWRSGSSFAGLASVVLLLLVLYTLFLDRFAGMLMYQAASKNVSETEYAFSETGIAVTSARETSELKYSAFLMAHETDTHFFLYIQKNVAVILPKADFTAGRPEDFAAYLAERLGKPVLRCRK